MNADIDDTDTLGARGLGLGQWELGWVHGDLWRCGRCIMMLLLGRRDRDRTLVALTGLPRCMPIRLRKLANRRVVL